MEKVCSEPDGLFAAALKFVIDEGFASISQLQRKFLIGYVRASNIIDEMEEHKLIADIESGRNRQVLISLDEACQQYNF